MALRARASFGIQQCLNKYPDDSHQTQFWRVMGPCTYCSNEGMHSGIGPYVEVAFYHKRSRTLLVTNAVIFVPRQPPECISKESLLASAENGLAVKILSKGKEVPEEPVIDNKVNRQKGWERMVLQILFLGPSNLLEPTASFDQMSRKLIVSPIVKTLVFSKVPEKVRDWGRSDCKRLAVQENHSCPFRSAHKCGQVRFLGSLLPSSTSSWVNTLSPGPPYLLSLHPSWGGPPFSSLQMMRPCPLLTSSWSQSEL